MKNSELSINASVLEQMASIAAKEVEGVHSLADKAVDIGNVVNKGKIFKAAKAFENKGAMEMTVYICVEDGADAREVAENVQKSVKEKIQNMTGKPISRVNVEVADVCISEEKK